MLSVALRQRLPLLGGPVQDAPVNVLVRAQQRARSSDQHPHHACRLPADLSGKPLRG
jgi:hypothetical protein